MKMRTFPIGAATALLGALCASTAAAQSPVAEDFTGTTTTNSWYYFNGACLTASRAAGSGSPGTPPGCEAIKSSYYNQNLTGGTAGVSGNTDTLPDVSGSGALRFTNGSGGGYSQNGAIISGSTFNGTAGVQVTFKTVTYRGDSGGAARDGADGISFFLMDGSSSVTPNIGSWGGSLGYTCSNSNADYHGMVGAYIGLGIDEYGNFLNPSDNTADGPGYVPNRIGLRGAGNIAWSYLNTLNATYYPSTLTSAQQQDAVHNTCRTGHLWNYSTPTSPTQTATTILDYPAIPNAYKVLSGVTIANEYSTGGYARSNATPILYKLKITSGGLLSLNYSFNGGAWQSVLANQDITSNGTLPAALRFGFAGSTGGSTNIHEVLCFKAASADTSSSSATSNQTQSSKVTSSTQAYFSYYDPNNWTGRLTANPVSSDSTGTLSVAATASWDASCVLTGVATNSTCPTTGDAGPIAAESPSSRVILTWNGSAGIPFQWSNLTAAQKSALDQGDASATANRVNYLRGDRTNEVNAAGVGLYRDRDYVLGDIVDSSPVAVGQPVLPYAVTWKDKLNPTATMSENSSSAQTYSQFVSAEKQRENIVYVGANDGLLHGFRSGAYDSTNSFDGTTNDGTEVLAYMPGSVLQSAASSSTSTNCASTVATQTIAQNIHGETPVIGSSAACTNATLDYSNTQYGHNFFVNGTPGTGDLFYGAAWHTWLVGGLGAGGAAIYALDITTPSSFSETNASTVVIGEWNASSISCTNVTTTGGCGVDLGNTYGTPLIRRLHNGAWAVIFGNGFGSSTGDAGIYVMTVDPSTAAKTFYYLSTGTGSTSSPNGIGYVSSADLDADHVTDYVYAGDLLGNVWRFDLTSSSPSSWAVSSGPLFSGGSTHPITSSVLVSFVTTNPPGTQVMLAFGTGQKTPLTNTTSATYAGATQYLYAFWDWNLAAWNTGSPSVQYVSMAGSATGLGGAPYTITPSKLTSQTLTLQSSGIVDISSSTICWRGTATCTGGTSGNASFGWSAALPSASEQIIYNPQLVGAAFNVNSIVPANNSVLSCTTGLDSGYSYALALATGGVAPHSTGTTNYFVNTTTTITNSNGTTSTVTTTNTDSNAAAMPTNATGQATVMTTSTTASSSSISSSGTGSSTSCTLGGTCNTLPTSLTTTPSPFSGVAGCSAGPGGISSTKTWLVYQTTSGSAGSAQTAVMCPLSGHRVTRTHVR
jgi:type IV pilus assembly protein PilY1